MIDVVAKLIELAGPRLRVIVAFSGGVDSTFLAHALTKHRRRLASLRLIHIDHGLQPASASWSKHSARLARAWGVRFESFNAHIPRDTGESPEAAARTARYELLAGAMEPGEVLVTAQHRDDQVETLLLQLFRGAGVAGLAAMPSIAQFGPGRIARPLLDVSRADIEAAARKARLRWVEDPSNTDIRFSRNFLRLRLMPAIREHWPGVDRALARSAAHMAEAQALLTGAALRDVTAAADGLGLAVSVLRALPAARRRNALRHFIARAGIELPEASRLTEMAGPLLRARADAQPEVRWANARMRRAQGRLELEVICEVPGGGRLETVSKSWRWEQQRVLLINAAGDSLALRDDADGALDLDKLPATLELRTRRGGEKLRPGSRARTQTLKSLMQGAKMPLAERARLPLLFVGDRLICAGDRWLDESVAANVKSRRRARLEWKRGHSELPRKGDRS